MSGRLEKETKLFTAIEEKISEYPLYMYDWYISLRASDCSAKTCKDYLNKVRRFLLSINEDIFSVSMKDINSASVNKYFVSVKTKKDSEGNMEFTSDSYQQGVWCSMNNFLGFLYKQRLIESNYMESIKKPKNKDLIKINNNRIRLNKNDFNRIINCVMDGCGSDKAKSFQESYKARDISIMLIFMTTGIRESALISINVNDVDFCKKRLVVTDKGDIFHVYNLTDQTIKYLREWIKERNSTIPETDALFTSRYGARMSENAVYKLVEKYCKEALGYKVSPHKLRSGFCSIMYEETRDIEKVRRIVGHANSSTTQRYIVTMSDEKEEAANIMTSILNIK